MDIPRPQLGDCSISQLVNDYSDGSPKWLTGSTVWLPAVFGQIDKHTDLDIVFQTKEGYERFNDGVFNFLYEKCKLPVTAADNGNGRRFFFNGDHIIDTWYLETDEHICELLATYPNDYQKCAFFMTWSGSSVAYLIRMVKQRTRFRQLGEARGVGYGRI